MKEEGKHPFELRSPCMHTVLPVEEMGNTNRGMAEIKEKIDLPMVKSQAFVQGELLPGDGHNSKVYISSPPGYDEDPLYVYRLLEPLYCIPSAARAWHTTMSALLAKKGCVCAGGSKWTAHETSRNQRAVPESVCRNVVGKKFVFVNICITNSAHCNRNTLVGSTTMASS